MDLWTATLFFRVCRRYGIKDMPDRVALARELARRKQAQYIRDVGEAVKGRNVIRIKAKRRQDD